MPTLKLVSQHKTRSRLPVVELKFFGEVFYFIVDTGAENTCISYRLFNKFNLSEEVFTRIKNDYHHGVGGIEQSQKVPVKINFLGKIIHQVTIGHFLDQWHKSEYAKFENIIYDGLLGQDVLSQFLQVTIDYVKKEIIFIS